MRDEINTLTLDGLKNGRPNIYDVTVGVGVSVVGESVAAVFLENQINPDRFCWHLVNRLCKAKPE